ncbi:MAG: PcfJ domain-containing protein, partial [Acetobacter sp.]|nr:PcfJ domain-containing protein [Acetobacter sp.]
KAKIRQAVAAENKKEIGIRLNQLITTKMALLKRYQEEKNLTPFTELSREAKIYTCTDSLFKKYLFAAFVQNIPNAYHINEDQSVTVNVESFLHSALYQQAQHIKDYVSSYLEHYPNRVQGSRYFVGLHKDAADMDDLVAIADEYFEKINEKNVKDTESLIKSHQGIEVVEIYPEHNVQVVCLLTKEALEYEGKQMSHCVASYAERVEKGETEIYSIRDYGDENTEYEPHATIEVKKGKIKQIKGYKDSLVDMDYIEETRRFIMSLMHTTDFSDVINSKDIPNSEKRNIGIMRSANGEFIDMLKMIGSLEKMTLDKLIVKSVRLKKLPLNQLNLQKLEINGPISAKITKQLETVKYVKELVLNAVCEEPVLDLVNIQSETITVNFKNETTIQKIILSPNLKKFTFNGDFIALTEIAGGENLEQIEGYGIYSQLQNIPQNLKKLKLGRKDEKENKGCKIQFENYHQLKELCITGYYPQLRGIPNAPQLEKFELNDGTYENIEQLDFSNYHNIKKIDLSRCTFPKLREIIVSTAARKFTGGHCSYPVLERIDILDDTLESFGFLEQEKGTDYSITTDDGIIHNFSFPKIYGCLICFSTMPKIKEIKLNENIKKISLTGMTFGEVNPLDFSRYKNLEVIDLPFSSFSKNAEIDLSYCKKLKEVRLDIEHVQQIILPPSVERMSVRKDKEYEIPSIDLSRFQKIKTLFVDFILSSENMPPDLEELNINLIDGGQSNVEELDFSTLKKLSIKTSALSPLFPNLKRIIWPEKFSDIILFRPCPNLQELDFTHTKQNVSLKKITFKDELFPSEGSIYLKPEQFSMLKKIKLGKDAYLELPLDMKHFSFTLELAYDMPKEKEQSLRRDYPNLAITRAPFPPQRLLSPLIKKRTITRG